MSHRQTPAGPQASGRGGVDPASRPPADVRHPNSPVHCQFFGLPFARLDLHEALELIVSQSGGVYSYVVTPNVAHIVKAHEQPGLLLPVYWGAWLSLCDSQIVRGLAALRGIKLPLVTGSDLVAVLLEHQNIEAARGRGKRILVVGPDTAVERILRERYAAARIEVMSAPSGLAQDAGLRLAVARLCSERPWDLLLLCVGAPAQEMIANQIGRLGRRRGVALCVGAAVDFITGRRARAPVLLQRLGLEWAYRLLREPRRLWRRYLVESPRIFSLYLAERRPPRR